MPSRAYKILAVDHKIANRLRRPLHFSGARIAAVGGPKREARRQAPVARTASASSRCRSSRPGAARLAASPLMLADSPRQRTTTSAPSGKRACRFNPAPIFAVDADAPRKAISLYGRAAVKPSRIVTQSSGRPAPNQGPSIRRGLESSVIARRAAFNASSSCARAEYSAGATP
jgi:hypothetical protein